MICMTCVTNSRMEKKVIMMIVSQQARSPIQLVSYRNSVQAQSAASPSQYIYILRFSALRLTQAWHVR